MARKKTDESHQLGLFPYMEGYVEMAGGDDLPDGAYFGILEESVREYNKQNGTNYDYYDIQSEWIDWHNDQHSV